MKMIFMITDMDVSFLRSKIGFSTATWKGLVK